MQNPFEQMSDHVFITYARADGGDFATRLHDDLEKNGVNTWLDKRDIKPGENFRAAIDKGLLGARVLIVLLSPVSLLSDEVAAEWNDALTRLVPIIPLVIGDGRIPPNLAIIQNIDFRADYDKALTQLLERLRHIEEDHLIFLRNRLSELQSAQQTISDPESLNYRIALLNLAIAYYSKGARVLGGGAPIEPTPDDATFESFHLQQHIVGQYAAVISHFHDRKAQQATIQKSLADPTAKLISVIGRGGMGKSGLVTKVLSDIAENQWEHLPADIARPQVKGIVNITIRPTEVPVERIFLDAARLLGNEQQSLIRNLWRSREHDLPAKISQFLEYFRDGLYIILLDNLEDLQNADGSLINADLYQFLEIALNATHGIKFLITSRLPMASNLTFAKLDQRVRLDEGLPPEDAVAMLQDLDHNGEANLLNEEIGTLQQAVELVHGVPRALEVIFSICQTDQFLTLSELIEQFRERPEIENLVADNFKRLDRDARYIMEALAVFARPAPITALGFMLQAYAPNVDVRHVVDRLARTATISIDRPTKTVNLHPIDRDYVYHALPKTGDYSQQSLEIRAADYYAQLRLPVEQWHDIPQIEPVINEFDHRVRAEQFEIAFDLLNSIDHDYLRVWGDFDRLIAMRGQLQNKLTDPLMVFDNMLGLGIVYMTRRDNHRAIQHFRAMLETPPKDSIERLGKLHFNLGMTHIAQNELEDAEHHIQKAFEIFEELGDKVLLVNVMHSKAMILLFRGQYTEAIDIEVQLQQLADEIGDVPMQNHANNTLSQLYIHTGRLEEAINMLESRMPAIRESRNKALFTASMGNLGMAYHIQKQLNNALTAYQEVMAVASEIGDKQLVATMLTNIGVAYADMGDFTEAYATQKKALEVVHEINHPQIEANILDNIGAMYQQQKRFDEAAEQFRQALKIANEINDPVGQQTFQQHLTENEQLQAADSPSTN